MTVLRTALDARLHELRDTPSWAAYERMRDWLLDSAGGAQEPSDYWSEELGTLDYLLDASPLVVAKLRHHAYPITGVRAYDYRTGKEDSAPRFAAKLDALGALGGTELRVPEPPLLGGFGHEVDGGLWNLDTLKYHETMVALELGAALEPFHRADERQVVWEVGGGWGGLAYQFKTLFSEVTYLIVDLPEVLLLSGTYLQTAFPDARIHLHGDGEPDWERDDFILVPHTQVDEVAPPRLDLTLNTVSFQEMTTDQVEGYARRAREWGSPLLYSLNRERSRYNPDLEGVSRILERHFWLNEIPVLPTSYLKLPEPGAKPPKRKKGEQTAEGDYRHLLGRRRL